MNRLAAFAVAIWVLVVGGNVVQTLIMPQRTFMSGPQFPWLVVAMPAIIILGAFRARRPLGLATFVAWIDRRYGQGTYGQFIWTLKPELLFAVMCFCIALEAIARAKLLSSPILPPQLIGFFASAGVAFLIAHYIRRNRAVS